MHSNDNFLGYFNDTFITLLNRTKETKNKNSVYMDWCTDCNHEDHRYNKSQRLMNRFDKMPQIEYKTNNYGLRSDDFLPEDVADNFLFSGCSNTFASGLPIEFSWASHFNSNFMKKSFKSVSVPSASCDTIIYNAYRYMNDIGSPEGIILLFPNIERYVSTEVHKFDDMDFEVSILNNRGNNSIFVKQDHGRHHLLRRFLQDILFFEEICKVRGIKLLWATWDEDFNNDIKKYFLNQVNHYYDMISNKIEPIDATELASKTFSDSPFWLESRDGHIPGLEQFIWGTSMIKGWKEMYEEYN